jgi:hypothetical protein
MLLDVSAADAEEESNVAGAGDGREVIEFSDRVVEELSDEVASAGERLAASDSSVCEEAAGVAVANGTVEGAGCASVGRGATVCGADACGGR